MSEAAQPELTTARLLLRPFRPSDADRVTALAGEREIALNTLNVPHPYQRRDAVEWIGAHRAQLERREAVTYAITVWEEGLVIGAAGLILDLANEVAELGYWIGMPYWGQGYASEAGRALVGWGFRELGLHRIHASHFPRNPASGAVLRKIGMSYEGRLREHVKKWGEHLDLERYGILRREFEADAGVVQMPASH
ncbi:MAG TPA: GNAT family N-acetyltransferase [Longimicrobiales bacterium]|nr:GNAT family N-acetyltransferase [Longimicrobiales bacterium]